MRKKLYIIPSLNTGRSCIKAFLCISGVDVRALSLRLNNEWTILVWMGAFVGDGRDAERLVKGLVGMLWEEKRVGLECSGDRL